VVLPLLQAASTSALAARARSAPRIGRSETEIGSKLESFRVSWLLPWHL
jgi:hypothetical protein